MLPAFLKPWIPCLIPGILFGIGAVGVYLISTYLRVTDLTTLGSFLISSVVSVAASNKYGPIPACLLGTLAGTACGGVTAILVCVFRVQIVLAGIASFSLAMSLAHLLSAGGSVSRLHQDGAFLQSAFCLSDLLAVLALAAAVCFFVQVLMLTRWGGLILAMTSSPDYKALRHRYRSQTAAGTILLGHTLIGLSGALCGLKNVTMGTELVNSANFLIIAFGAVFGGYVFSSWGKKFLSFMGKKVATDASLPEIGGEAGLAFRDSQSKALKLTPPELNRLGMLLVAIVFGCVLLNAIMLLTSKFGEALGYLIQALCIIGFALCAGAKHRDSTL